MYRTLLYRKSHVRDSFYLSKFFSQIIDLNCIFQNFKPLGYFNFKPISSKFYQKPLKRKNLSIPLIKTQALKCLPDFRSMDLIKKFKQLIDKAESIIISTHIFPDADGIGSQIALCLALSKLNKKVYCVNEEGLSSSLFIS